MQILSWGELITGLVVVAILWYGYVALKYYRKELTGWTKRRAANNAPVRWSKEAVVDNPVASTSSHAQVHELMEELKMIFAAAVRDQLLKEQILEAVRGRLINYSSLAPQIKLSVAQHIINEFSLQLKIPVTPEEINSLWP